MITQWSYSRLSLYQSCPAKAKYKYLDKLADEAGPAAQRGVYFHKVCEEFVRGALPELPPRVMGDPPLHEYEEALRKLRELKPLLEHQVGFTREWAETGFFAKDVWARAVYDVIYYDDEEKTVVIIDYKTGKPSASHMKQLELYSATGLVLFPEAERAVSKDWYIDKGPGAELTHTLERKFLPPILKLWKMKVEQMEADTTFAPRPGNHCRWCAFAKNKGGPCRFS